MEHLKPPCNNPQSCEPSRASAKGARLRRRLRAFVLLIICSYFIFSLAILFELSEHATPRRLPEMERERLMTTAGVGGQNPAAVAGEALQRVYPWIWLGILMTAAALAATYLYTRKLLAPLEEVSLTAGRIARGQLDQPAAIRNDDEIGDIAECINDIAANQQEILLHLWTQTGHSLNLIDRITSGIVTTGPNDGLAGVKKDLTSVKRSMESLRALVDDIDFYQVRLQDAKVRATSESRTGRSPKSD